MTESQIIFQRDSSLVVTPGANRERVAAVARQCAELRKVVAGSYLYRLSTIALWGSAARGLNATDVLGHLDRHAIAGVPASFAAEVAAIMSRYGVLRLVPVEGGFRLEADDPAVLADLEGALERELTGVVIPSRLAGRVKMEAARAGWPVVDRQPDTVPAMPIHLNESIRLRPYQAVAVNALERAKSGVVLLPCGAGKTLVGVAALSRMGLPALVLGPSRSVAEQWRATLLEATNLDASQVGIASAGTELKPVTIATYHAASLGQVAGELVDRAWSTVIYDEVQSLPADMFRLSAALTAPHKIGLTATLVREDGRQRDVFALVGPPVYDVAWTELEADGWIAPARCVEVRIPESQDDATRLRYKQAVVARLLSKEESRPTLVVGSRLDSLVATCNRFDIPVLTGSSGKAQRARLLAAFRNGEVNRIGLSKIGSVGIDLPGAEVLIQISGTFGSRQEEAQRLGRILRPAPGKIAQFYTLVSEGTSEVRHAERRQRFLVEQGYTYDVIDASELPRN